MPLWLSLIYVGNYGLLIYDHLNAGEERNFGQSWLVNISWYV